MLKTLRWGIVRQLVCTGSSSRCVHSVCVGRCLNTQLGRLADEVMLDATGHQVHHITCRDTGNLIKLFLCLGGLITE